MTTTDHESINKVDDEVEVKINNLKKCINTIHKNFETLRDGLLETAKKLDEDKICKRDEICNKIKEYLKEEIQNAKITSRWIEQSLPKEYKRKYENKKSEVSSLSDKEKEKEQDKKIMITADGTSANEEIKDNIADSDPTIKLNDNLSNPLKTDDLSENSTNEDCCSLCKPIHEKNIELEEAFKSVSLQTADKVKSIKIKIPKKRQIEINEEFNKCKEEVIVECHGYDKIVSIKADIFKENNHQQSNSSTSNDQYNNNDTSNDDYTY
jgi:hypothetical protein